MNPQTEQKNWTQEIDDWLKEKTRSSTFEAWMESLNERLVKRASGEGYSTAKFEKNWSTSRR
jgi:hypothetical protein